MKRGLLGSAAVLALAACGGSGSASPTVVTKTVTATPSATTPPSASPGASSHTTKPDCSTSSTLSQQQWTEQCAGTDNGASSAVPALPATAPVLAVGQSVKVKTAADDTMNVPGAELQVNLVGFKTATKVPEPDQANTARPDASRQFGCLAFYVRNVGKSRVTYTRSMWLVGRVLMAELPPSPRGTSGASTSRWERSRMACWTSRSPSPAKRSTERSLSSSRRARGFWSSLTEQVRRCSA